jgi:hypothetical protein
MTDRLASLMSAYALKAPPLGPSGPTGRITEVGSRTGTPAPTFSPPETGGIWALAPLVWAALKWAGTQLAIFLTADMIVSLAMEGDEELAELPMLPSDWEFWTVRLNTLEDWGNGFLTAQRRWAWRITVEKARKHYGQPINRLQADALIRELREVVLPSFVEQEQAAKSGADLPSGAIPGAPLQPTIGQMDAAHQEATAQQLLDLESKPSPATWALVIAGIAGVYLLFSK